MQDFFKFLPSVRTLFILAGMCALIVYGFKDAIVNVAVAGNNEGLTLILAFLVFFLITTLGVAGFYAISKKEIQAEARRSNIAKVSGSKKVKGKQRGKGGLIEVDKSEEVELEQDSEGEGPSDGPEGDKKKT